MNITIKDVEYNLERLLVLHHKGVRTKIDTSKIIGWDAAPVSIDIEHAIVVPTSDNKLLAVLRPVHSSNMMFVLSKYILKQCLPTIQYTPTDRYGSYNYNNHPDNRNIQRRY